MAFHFSSCRLSSLPTQLNLFLQVRLISSSTTSTPPPSHGRQHSYPYPTHARPTPYQIFHLSPGASQKDIKARYYDLVRAHHPDSTLCRSLPAEERHARFQAITAAYDILRGKTSGFTPRDPYREEVLRRKHMYQTYHNRRAEYTHPRRPDWTVNPDDRWKDRVILIVGILTLAAGLAPGLFILPYVAQEKHKLAASNLKRARKDAQEYGEVQREKLRERARDILDGKLADERDKLIEDDIDNPRKNPR